MVVGNLIYSILLGMSVPDVSGKAIANLEVESLRHTAPTFHGDTIYGETTVLDKRESGSKPDRGVVTVETKGYKQDGTLVCVFRRRVMVPKKSHSPARRCRAFRCLADTVGATDRGGRRWGCCAGCSGASRRGSSAGPCIRAGSDDRLAMYSIDLGAVDAAPVPRLPVRLDVEFTYAGDGASGMPADAELVDDPLPRRTWSTRRCAALGGAYVGRVRHGQHGPMTGYLPPARPRQRCRTGPSSGPCRRASP